MIQKTIRLENEDVGDAEVIKFKDQTGVFENCEIRIESDFQFGTDGIPIKLNVFKLNEKTNQKDDDDFKKLVTVEFEDCLSIDCAPNIKLFFRDILTTIVDKISDLIDQVLAKTGQLTIECSYDDNFHSEFLFILQFGSCKLEQAIGYDKDTDTFSKL